MAYRDFKNLAQAHKQLGITIKATSELYQAIKPAQLSPWFIETMKMAYIQAIRINTESARQALIVNHVLMELNQQENISFLFILPKNFIQTP